MRREVNDKLFVLNYKRCFSATFLKPETLNFCLGYVGRMVSGLKGQLIPQFEGPVKDCGGREDFWL